MYMYTDWLEGAAGFVGAGADADRDEGHALRTGDGAASRVGIEAHEGADLHGHLGAVDSPVATAATE